MWLACAGRLPFRPTGHRCLHAGVWRARARQPSRCWPALPGRSLVSRPSVEQPQESGRLSLLSAGRQHMEPSAPASYQCWLGWCSVGSRQMVAWPAQLARAKRQSSRAPPTCKQASQSRPRSDAYLASPRPATRDIWPLAPKYHRHRCSPLLNLSLCDKDSLRGNLSRAYLSGAQPSEPGCEKPLVCRWSKSCNEIVFGWLVCMTSEVVRCSSCKCSMEAPMNSMKPS